VTVEVAEPLVLFAAPVTISPTLTLPVLAVSPTDVLPTADTLLSVRSWTPELMVDVIERPAVMANSPPVLITELFSAISLLAPEA
jgi:hypothetical protein